MRGKAGSGSVLVACARITPACAGKSQPHLCNPCQQGDHPRVCGEKLLHAVPLTGGKGSPPRVRGKVLALYALSSPLGITPACAGKRQMASAVLDHSRDHPRVCGEKEFACKDGSAITGSPPRVRGKELLVNELSLIGGITPACAGKRHCRPQRRSRCKDHPRVCGEKPALPGIKSKKQGSPPRVRGKD